MLIHLMDQFLGILGNRIYWYNMQLLVMPLEIRNSDDCAFDISGWSVAMTN